MAHPDFTKLTEADILAMLATVNTNTIIGDTLPENPDPGSLWFDQTRAKLYTYYDDGDSGQWVSAGGGLQVNIDAAGGGAFEADANTQITPLTPIVLDQATGDEAALTLDYTTNKATSGDDTGLLINQTDTASPGTSKLLDLQAGGVSKLSVDDAGGLSFPGSSTYQQVIKFSNTYPGYLRADGAVSAKSIVNESGGNFLLNSVGIKLGNSAVLSFTQNSGISNAADLELHRDAANTLAQRNGVNAQTSNIYNTYTSATDYERAHIGWNDTADTFVIGTEAGSGGGAVRDMSINTGVVSLQGGQPGNELLRLCHIGANNDQATKAYVTYYRGANTNRVGYSGFSGSNTFEISTDFTAGQFRLRTGNQAEALLVDSAGDATFAKSVSMQSQDIAQGTLTDDAQALDITSTWNDAADTFTLIKADVTNTASAADSKLLDLQVGGASKLSVDSAGKLTTANLELTNTAGAVYTKWDGATKIFSVAGDAFAVYTTVGETRLYQHAAFGWTAGVASTGSLDLILRKAAAATLQLGTDHATVATGQTIKAHDVVTGAGADLTLSGGLGSAADGAVILQPTSGNVGIGTTSPSHALDVVGPVNIDATGSYKKEGTTVLDYDSTRFNVSVGELALSDALLTGNNNTASGYSALANNTTGNFNTASGYAALANNTTGDNNTASGSFALQNNTTGGSNTASGRFALQNNTGSYNTASGNWSLNANSGNNNTASGYSALLYNTTGDNNTASGYAALANNNTGDNNTASGYAALANNNTGDNNTAVGYQAGRYQANGSTALTVASNSVFIGKDTRGVNGATNQIVIGDTAIGLGSNTTVLGSAATTQTQIFGGIVLPDLPTADPANAGELWNDSGTLKVSAG